AVLVPRPARAPRPHRGPDRPKLSCVAGMLRGGARRERALLPRTVFRDDSRARPRAGARERGALAVVPVAARARTLDQALHRPASARARGRRREAARGAVPVVRRGLPRDARGGRHPRRRAVALARGRGARAGPLRERPSRFRPLPRRARPRGARQGARMTRQEKADCIGVILDELFPMPPVPLEHVDPFTLLVAVVLSAQCTDERVNATTPRLFARASTPAGMVRLAVPEIREIIKPCGLSPAKSKALHALSKIL